MTGIAGSSRDLIVLMQMKGRPSGRPFCISGHQSSPTPTLPPACLPSASHPLLHVDPASVRKNLKETSMTIRHLNQIELAARLNISPRTLERWRWTGEGPRYMKVGGRVVYRLEDVEGYEASQLRNSTAEISSKPAA
jgi:hypothetical protein